jgi:hypothetical protein
MARFPTRPWLTAVASLAALGLGACGSSPSSSPTSEAKAPPPTTVVPPGGAGPKAVPIPPAHGRVGAGVKPGDVRIVRAWADTLRRGQIGRASGYFSLPTVVSNGTGPITLHTRADVRFFNETLPCGAVLIRTATGPRGFVIATFRLTERPGAGTCGSGVGQTAQTAFKIRAGRIVDWLRVADVAKVQGTPS